MRNRHAIASRAGQAGVGLVEILVAVLVLGFGLLGLAAMQSLALRNSQSAMEKSQAVMQAYSMIDSMRANPEQAKNGAYNSRLCATASATSTENLAGYDKAQWVLALQNSFGKKDTTCMQVDCDKAGLCLVSVQWDDSRGGGAGGEANGDKTTYTLQAQL